MLFTNSLVALAATLPALTSAYGVFLTDPDYKSPRDWNRAARDIEVKRREAKRYEEIARRQDASTMTRGSQTNPTDPCFNVYQYPSPTANAGGQGPDGTYGHGYQPPQSNDVRGPCPALNTLANHGYLPRDGRFINGSTLINAFLNGWGIDESVIAIPKTNALNVCNFQSGGAEDDNAPEVCEEFDLNILNTPHQFEHDHSLSRRDYESGDMNQPSDNHIFNGTIFNQSLAVLDNSCYMTIQQANQVRLQRESDAYVLDKDGWFTLAPGTQNTEIGFIFAVMSEANQPNGSGEADGASVRVDWWQYWFLYESFPTDLGWQPPCPAVTGAFVQSISSMVQQASITSTPSPFFTEFINGPTGTFPSSSVSGQPYFNPTIGNLYTSSINVAKRDFVAEATATPVAPWA